MPLISTGLLRNMAIQRTVHFGPLCFCQFLVLLCMNWSVDAAVVDPCQPQFPCVPRTKMGDPDNCRRYYECNYPEGQQYPGNKTLSDKRPRWMPKICRFKDEHFSIRAERCVLAVKGMRRCQSKCKETIFSSDVYISLDMDAGQYHGLNRTLEVNVGNLNRILEGTTVQFFCSFRYLMHGYVVPAEQFVWLLNERQITSSGKQTIIASDTRPDDKGFFNSTLIFASVTGSETGSIQCGVQYNGIFAVYTDPVPLSVWTALTVLISPASLTVFNYDQIVLKCSVHPGRNEIIEIKWFKDGNEIEPGGDSYIELTQYSLESRLKTSAKFYNTSVQFSCMGFSPYGNTTRETIKVFVIKETGPYCPTVFGEKHFMTWSLTKGGTTSIQACEVPKRFYEKSKLSGMCSRKCELKDGKSAVWLPPNCNECVDTTHLKLLAEIELLEAGVGLEDQSLVAETAEKLAAITNATDGLTPGNLNLSLEVISRLTSLRRGNPNIDVAEEEVRSIVQSISNLLEPINSESWKALQTKKNMTTPVVFFSSADVYGKRLAKLSDGTESSTVSIISNNMVLEARRFDQMSFTETNAISFPLHMNRSDEDWIASRGDRISVSTKSLHQICTSGSVMKLWSSYFRNIENYLPETNYTVIGSRVISLSVESSSEVESFSQPIKISLQHRQEYDSPVKKCVFWKFDSSGKGYWDESGCSVISTNDTHTFCQCNHLTSFAILFRISPSVDVALSIISTVGCSISVAALILTVIVYALSWREVKSDQAAVLLNLCVALIVANTIFLVGADKTSHQDVCKAVAVLLHYFFLAAFFLMLAEGVELLFYVIFVFHVRRKIETAMFIVCAWVLPLIVVAVSLGLTKTDGYSSSQSCWLSVENGLIWAFVEPAVAIVLINFIILIFVLKRVSADRVPSSNDEKTNKIRASMWNMAVICPVIGIAWVFGVLSVSFNHIVFQYIFAVANSSQGLFIFIFHVLMRKKDGNQGSLILNIFPCGRFKSYNVTSTSGSNVAGKKPEKTAKRRLHGKKDQKETQPKDCTLVHLSSESSEI